MDTVTIEITPQEKARLLFYSERVRESGHWGDGAVEMPDEKILEDRISRAEGTLDLTPRDLDVLTTLIDDATDHGLLLLPEDLSILAKLVEGLEGSLRSALSLVERYGDMIRNLTSILPHQPPHEPRAEETPGTGEPRRLQEADTAAAPAGADRGTVAASWERTHRPEADTVSDESTTKAAAAQPTAGGIRRFISQLRSSLTPSAKESAARYPEEPTLDERIRAARELVRKINKKR
jgi:hypothetical protein